ncbi:MAG: AAA family ATPase [Candidatus Lokiarchaeota archaeon]|nr:AAA family ATPase [Candidatus Lokiarchaeota archaeon]
MELSELLLKDSMRFTLFGGKGGVGKTTCASASAVWAADHGRETLVISTDPAHSLSDSFDLDLSGGEVLVVPGFENLYGLEINPSLEFQKYQETIQNRPADIPEELSGFMGGMEDFTSITPPGSDESLAFSKVLEFIQTSDFEYIIFDTAPSGHTLRLLSLPEVLNSFFGKMIKLRMKLGNIWGKLKGLFSKDENDEPNKLEMLNEMKKNIEAASGELSNPEKTEFVIVMIPEMMAILETERLLRALYEYEIPVHNIIVNMILPPNPDCEFCNSRRNMQQKNIKEIRELYEDFNLKELYLQPNEIRGIGTLRELGKTLIE